MKNYSSKFLLILVMSFFTLGFSYADEPVNGKFSTKLVSQNVLPIDERGHILRLAEAMGVNQGGFLNGWKANNKEIDDLVQGNGSQSGHLVFTKGTESVSVAWNGSITTVLGENKQPMTTFDGKWSFTGGTGENASIEGGGKYKGYFTSETEYTVEWEGFRK